MHYNDVAAAVDSFMNGPNCLITEDSFIRRSVEAKTFPCPSVSSDPCALKREEMIQELWPGTKYGKYTIQMPSRIINGPSPDDTTSIFDKIPYCCKPDSMIYRYQDTCIVSLPPYVVKGLDTFRNLQTMSADSFIYIFNDSIAAALLPLHPEYCALQQCYVDTFEARLEAIPNAQVALGLNLLSLDSIIKQDPLQPILRLKPFLYAHPEDSLATFMGGKIRLDSIELMKDWCGCADSFQFRECVNHIFNKELSSRSILNNSFVENTYFNDIITMYLQNRERFKNAMTTGGEHDSCWHCQNVRMHLIPSPVFQSVFLPGGGLDLSKGSAWYSMDTSSALLAGLTADFDSSSIPADSLVKLGDSASSYVGSADSVLCVGQIDTILNHLSNCIQGSTTIYNGIQNTLDSLCNAHAVQYGTYSPAQIRFAILRNGGTLTDLCNPYLINYDYFGPEMNSGGSCKSPAYYTNIQNFLNQTAALSSFKKAASSSPSPVSAYTLNTGSTFENAIAALTGSTSVNMFATYQSTSNMYTLFIYKTSPTDTVKVYLRGMPGVSNPFNGLTTDSFAVNNVACITSITPPITVGYIGELSFVGNLYHKSGSTITNSSLLGWTDSVEAMDYLQNPLQQCVPCTQIRALYTQFWDSLTVYGVKGADHPFYQTMLGNFMNYFIGQSYTAGQYQDFITSCALADSVLIPDYVGYANFLFSNTTYANSFDSALQAQDPLVFINPYRETFSGFEMVELDLRKLPSWELYKYVNVCNYWKTNHSTLGVLADGVNLPTQALERPSGGRTALGLVYYPTAYTFSPSPSVIFNTSSTNVTFGSPHLIGQWTGGHFVNQEYDTLYAASGTPPYEISKDIYQLRSYAYNNHIPVSFISNYESTVNPDYFKPQKTAYLQYAYKYQQSPPYQVLDSLQALYLQQRVALFGSEFLSYTRPFDPTTLTNLYIADPTLTSNLYDTLESVFQKVSGSATYAGPIFFSSNAQKIANNLYVYRCSDGTYWFRYFGAGDTLYNAYVQMPTYLPQSAHSSYQITSVGTLPGVQPIPGDSTSRFFVLNMEIPGQPSTAIQASGMTDFVIAKNIELDNVLLSGTTYGAEYNMPDSFDNCERVTLKSAISEGIHDWHKYLDSTSQALKAGFMAYVMGAIGEQMLIQYRDQEFDYTLTYYDRAGNRMETVPPQGVQLLDTNHLLLSRVDTSRINNTDTALSQFPAHQKTSTYDYNSNNQLVHQSTPDGGKVDIYYDLDNREIFSQNDKQRTVGSYTYHLYDDQNRLIETGQVDNMGYPWFSDFYEFSMMGDTIHSFPHFSYPSSVPNEFLISPNPRWVEYPAVGWLSPVPADSVPIYVRQYQREDVVMTIYDTAAKNLGIVSGLDTQTNLRERTSCLKFFTTLSPTDTFFNSYTYASHCSYDVDGNLKTLTQEFPALGNTYKYQRYKRIDYDYDLVSGKVNLLSYNRGFPDQFYQRYAYDADNRITSVQTSNDGYIWSTDATYQYYKHGPLARETLGDPLEGVVQGIDYAYTIQGWLKQVNSDTLNGTMDMGLDTGYLVPKDIVAGSIDYFNGDYSNILGASQTHVAAPTLSLYNGNIARQTVAINNLVRLNKQYVYDQLNRINSANYATINAVNQTISGLNDYHNTYQYDNDGNLKQLVRYGNSVATNGTKSTPVLMDSLAYFYPYTIPNNMLRQVTDQSPNNYSNDIQQYTDSTRSRYLYDPTGNMIKDQVSGQDTLTWNLYNKLTSTSNRTADNNMTFVYDGAGNRVAKYFTQINDTGSVPETQNNDYYVRDLQGNILAIYHENYTYKDAPLTPSGWVIPVDDAARTYIGGTSPGHSLNSGFFIPNYASIGAFQTQVIKSSQYNGTFTTSELNHPPSYFMSASSAIYQNMLTGSSGWVVPLGTYEATPHPVLGPAYQAMFAANNIGLAQTLTAALFSDPNTTTQTTVLEIMCSTGNNNLMNQFASMVGVAPNANCNTTAANVQVALEGMSPTAIATDWKNLYSSNPTQMQQFLNLLAYNSTVYSESYYVGTGGQLLPVIQNVLSTYGNPTNVEPFFDQWTGAAAELRAVNTTASLLQIPYNASPITYVNALDDASGDHTIDTAVAAVPGLSYVGYVSALSSTMSIPYSALPVEVSPTSQTFYLAEHDIYGSSRIGAKTYYPTQISAAWTYGSSPTTDTLRLYNRNPWYSEEYQDDIATDSTNLYGNPYLGSLSVQHQEGQKQYELDDHLGDVLATITDKRRGKDLNADGTIDHYVASPEAIYDYFPYGMLMPGRYNVDTSTHCEIVTETGWVPQTVSGSYPLGTSCQPCGITTIGSGTVTYLSPGARLSTTHTGDGMSWANTSVAGATYTTTLGVSGVTGTSYSVQVLDGTTQAVLTGTTIAQAGNIPLVYTAASNSTLFKVTSISATSGTLTCTTAVFSYTILVQGTVATNVCNNNKDSYRYGFNGKLKDNEYAGIGNSLDFGDRGLDTRIGRFRTPDPLTKKFPYYSPYLFAGDKPTVMIDVAGQSEHHYSVAVTIDDKNKMRVTSFKEIKGEAKIDHWQAPWDETFNSMELRAPYVSYPEKRVFNVDVYKQRQNGSTEYDKTVTLEWTPPVKDSRVKENGSIEGGWHLVTTDGEGGDEQRFNKNAGLGSRNVDAGTILRTMKALMAFGRTQPTDPIEALEDLNNSVDLGKDMATDPDKAGIINVDAGGKKEAKKFDQCSSCGEYRNKETHEEINPNDTAGKGITKDNTNVENLEQFHQ
ncbi:MAG TPA: hypothetical protein VN721_06700 [Flavipsychrobacter sp.]|nr:hypothetical protein [Flavipsychrobacter sp.]